MLQRTLPAGFIAPWLPTKTDKLPSGSQWVHEIKHVGFRVIARKSPPLLADRRDVGTPPALSTPKLSPAMTTALLRSISSVTSALTRAYSFTPLISSS